MSTKNIVVSRREFVVRSAAAAAAPFFLPSSAPVAGANTAPNDRIAMGFIGLGGQGSGHLFGGAWTYVTGGYLGRDDVQVLGVCDVWQNKRDAAKKRVNDYYAQKLGKGSYHACEAYRDFRELLARDDIDAVLMALPIHWHGPMAAMAAKAGKDVYCEKPTAVTIRESQTVVEAVQRYGRVFQAGTQQRSEYGGKFREACELVRSGRIGKLKEVYAYRAGGGFATRGWPVAGGRPTPDGLDWDLWLGPAPWRTYPGSAGAFMFAFGGINWGQHHYDIVQWGLGADRTGPVELDFVDGKVVYTYSNGIVVYGCECPDMKVGRSGGACFVGTDGRIAVDRGRLVADPPDVVREPLGPDDVHLYESASHGGNFLKCVRTRKRTICDVQTAHRAVSALLLGGIAMTLKRQLKWDPAQEQFVGDDKANRLLSYAKRASWRE